MPKPRKRSEALKETVQELKKTAEQKQTERYHYVKQCFNTVAGSDEGRVVFQELAKLCNFGKSKVVADMVGKTIHLESTAFNCAQENIWIRLRKFIRREYLIKIEYPITVEE